MSEAERVQRDIARALEDIASSLDRIGDHLETLAHNLDRAIGVSPVNEDVYFLRVFNVEGY